MKIQYLTIAVLLLVSCSESKMLRKSLSNFNLPIDYLHDSKISSSPKKDYLYVKLNNSPVDSLTSVTKLKGKLLPLLFFTYTESNMSVKLGQSSLQKNYNDFFYNSFLDESKRTGCFDVSPQPKDSAYTLEITVDTCSTMSKYRRSTTVLYLIFAYSMSFTESGSPSTTNLHVLTKLKKGNLLIAEKSYNINNTQPFLNSGQTAVKKLRSDFVVNMVESLSLSTKQCIEKIIDDTNAAIGKNRLQPTSGRLSGI